MAEYTEKMRKGKEIIIRAACVVLVIGLGIMAFPYIKQWLYDRNAREQIREFEDRRDDLAEGEPDDLQDLYAAMQAYNRDLYEKRAGRLPGRLELPDSQLRPDRVGAPRQHGRVCRDSPHGGGAPALSGSE